MKTKNIYIYTGNIKEDFKFRQKDIEENNIKPEDIFTDVSFEEAYRQDVIVGGYYSGWDEVRIIDRTGREEVYKKVWHMKRII